METDTTETAAEETASPQDEVDAFDAAFHEFEAAADAPETVQPDSGNAREDDGQTGNTGGDAGGQESGTDAEPGEHPASGDTDNTDPWSSVPESLRGERDSLLNENNALRGRVPGLQRELEELRRFKSKTEARPTKKDGTDATSETGEDPLSLLRSEYPEVAGPVEQMLLRQQETIDGLREKVDTHDQTFAAGKVQAEIQRLVSDDEVAEVYQAVKYGGARNDEFVRWYQMQPASVQAMVERNGNEVVDADETRAVITLFQAHASQPDTGLPGTEKAGSEGDDTGLEQKDRRRKAMLKSAEGVRGKSPGVGRSIPDKDAYDATWDHLEEQEARSPRA